MIKRRVRKFIASSAGKMMGEVMGASDEKREGLSQWVARLMRGVAGV